jgi:hypothetical protein
MMGRMIVRLSSTLAPELVDLDRLDRLHAEPADDADVHDFLLADWCRLDDDGEHLWLDIDACRRLGRAERGDAWADQYDGMIAYARTKGWTDAADTGVRAHIRPVGD